MEEQDVLQRMEDWGYLLLHKPHPRSPGYRQLLVALRRVPTEKHFDPSEVRLWLRDQYGVARLTTLALDPLLKPLPEPRQVCPGMVTLYDRKEKRTDFFTFGGLLNAVFGSGEVVLSLRSPVPIIWLVEPADVATRLVAEVEASMAEISAKWGPDEEGYLRRLVAVDPLELYAASLGACLKRCEEHSTIREDDVELYDLVRDEQEWLLEIARRPMVSPLTELLAPEGASGKTD